MNHPFTIIRGGQAADKKPPRNKPSAVQFAQFDQKMAIRERIRNRHIADRDRVVERLRAKGEL